MQSVQINTLIEVSCDPNSDEKNGKYGEHISITKLSSYLKLYSGVRD